MATPQPTHSTTAGLGERIASYSEQLDADHARFQAELSRDTWRYAVLAVLGTILVVGGGIIGFEHATRYRSVNYGRRTLTVIPKGAMVVVINPP